MLKKKIIKEIILSFIIIIILGILVPTYNIKATTSEKVKDNYKKWLSTQDTKVYFSIVNINDDSIPELITANESWYDDKNMPLAVTIYSYVDGKIREIGNLSSSDNVKLYYNKDKKKYIAICYSGFLDTEYNVLSVQDNQLKSDVIRKSGDGSIWSYYHNNKEISEKIFNDHYEKDFSVYNNSGEFNSNKFKEITYYQNSYKNRSLYLSCDISSKNITLSQKETKKLVVYGATKKVTWSSSNTSIATVNNEGTVIAKKSGKVIITAKIGSNKYTCKVTVSNTIDVTLSKKEKVSKIINFTKNYLALFSSDRSYDNSYDKSEISDFKYDDVTKTNMTCYSIGKYNPKESEIKSKLEMLFGENSKLKFSSSATFPYNLYLKNDNEIIYNGGDWGDVEPWGKIEKIYETSSNTCLVKYKSGFKDNSDGKVTICGTFNIYLKTNNKSNYKYIITNIKCTSIVKNEYKY